MKTITEWQYDDFADQGYNVVGAFEVALMNLEIVAYIDEWGMLDLEYYSRMYKGANNEHKHGTRTCPESGGTIYTDEEFDRRIKRVNAGTRTS